MNNRTLKYRTFDQLMADVKNDFKKYDLKDLIDPQEMIKVTKKINYDLGLRITQTKEKVLEVKKGRVKLPNNYYTMNFAMMCGSYKVKQYMDQGTHVEERLIDAPLNYQQAPPDVNFCERPAVPDPEPECDHCCPQCQSTTSCGCAKEESSCHMNCKGEKFELVQIVKYQVRHYDFVRPIVLQENSQEIECDCPNLYWESPFSGWIKDGWLYLNFDEGKVYINYNSLMEDDEGNLLVVDHDLINDYYEYALKRRLLENLIMNDEPVSPGKIQLIESRHREARVNAKSVVNTPNFGELREMWKSNRSAMYGLYFNMFKSYPPRVYPPVYNRSKWQNK